MKTLVISIDPAAAGGDLIMICYRSPRGGRTHVAHRCDVNETREKVADILAQAINKEWMSEAFQARINENGQLIVNCADSVSDVKFDAEVEGDGGTTVTLTEF